MALAAVRLVDGRLCPLERPIDKYRQAHWHRVAGETLNCSPHHAKTMRSFSGRLNTNGRLRRNPGVISAAVAAQDPRMNEV